LPANSQESTTCDHYTEQDYDFSIFFMVAIVLLILGCALHRMCRKPAEQEILTEADGEQPSSEDGADIRAVKV
jgi:hypothetical protein